MFLLPVLSLITVGGFLIYARSSDAKTQEIAKIMFLCGMLVTCMKFADVVIKLPLWN